jgi:hypothetical protein
MIKKYVLTVLLCVGAASCAKGPALTADDGPSSVATAQPGRAGADAKPQAGKSKHASAPQAPAIPAGAEWTIYCTTVPGAAHIQQSTQLRDQLIKSTGMRDWYVIHSANESTLYYGFYKSLDKTIKATRQKIDAMTDASQNRPFRNALIVELTAPDPEAPPQWDLANAPAGMVWSVQIAAYEGSPQRKKFAVDAVKDARAQGVPAYYFHGPSISSVCVGVWPKQAVRGDMEPAFNDPGEKRTMEQIMQQQPADLIVLPPGMPAVNRDIRTKRGRMRTLSPQLEVVDPTMLATMKAYPYHFRNGEAEGTRTQSGLQPKPSFLVKIPRRGGSLLGGGDGAVAGAEPGVQRTGSIDPLQPPSQPADQRRPAPAAPGYGRLRSLGGN